MRSSSKTRFFSYTIICLLFVNLHLKLHQFSSISKPKVLNKIDVNVITNYSLTDTSYLSSASNFNAAIANTLLCHVSKHDKDTKTPIKIGLVNVDEETKDAYSQYYNDDHFHRIRKIETLSVNFEPLSKNITWENIFPEWIDEDHKWGTPKCPEIPMPSRLTEDYGDLDVIVAKLPCVSGPRDVFRLQVNLVVANLAVAAAGDEFDRTVYVVLLGSCEPMQEIFRCDDMVTSSVGEYWVYKPELGKLKQKVLMPVGSCQIGSVFTETGKESWRPLMQQSLHLNKNINRKRFAYATVLHSSEAYVCGAIVLAQSIKQTNSTNDLILLHDSSITHKSLQGLKAAGWKTRLIRRIRSPFSRKGSYNEWNYSKLRIWQLFDYEKVMFIDSDILVLKKIDEFFYYPQLSASRNDKVLFNSGIMVIEPSNCMFKDLISKSYKLASYNGGDQGFLNEVFIWWHRLPSKLNFLKAFNGKNKTHKIRDDLYAIHFLGWKPWRCYRDYDCNWDMLDHHIFASDFAHSRWWNVYDSMPKKLQGYCGMTKSMDSRIKKLRGRAKKDPFFPDGHWEMKLKDPRQYHLI